MLTQGVFALLTITGSAWVIAGQVNIAVTSNFDFTAEELKREFETQTEHTVILNPGPSNQHFNRIVEGASFDIFLSDDVNRAEVLERTTNIPAGSRFTYAMGRLVLWSVNSRSLGPRVLQEKDFMLLAATDPRLSPYGRAAEEFLQALDLWEDLQEQLVIGKNIGETYHFAISGDVDMALIPFSQIIYGDFMQAGSYWPIPENFYAPIVQQGVLLTANPAAIEFLQFMLGPSGKQIISSNGFHVP